MIIAKSPVRISLAGGSTDLEEFLRINGQGSVISFSANLYTFITLRRDKLGRNGQEKQYLIEYMKREIVDHYTEIKNDVARVALDYFKIEPITCWFTSDFYSSGSGLASSSAYLNAFVKAASIYKGHDLSNYDVCKLSHQLERKFNPLTGYQDPYGCGLGGFNRLNFEHRKDVAVEKLDKTILDDFDMWLIHTGVARKSTPILRSINIEKCVDLLQIVEEMHSAIKRNDTNCLLNMVNEGWYLKKKTSKRVTENQVILDLDESLEKNENVLAHRLLGAGNGGYFLAFVRKGCNISKFDYPNQLSTFKIEVCTTGVSAGIFR